MKRNLFTFVLLLVGLVAGPAGLRAQLSPSAIRVLGQVDLRQNGFNSVDGSELANPSGVAIDERDGQVHVYVADASNNRVLAWRDIQSLENGARADIALGQRSLRHTIPLGIGNAGLSLPSAVAVNPATGDLYVADTNHHRVLRFLEPFANTARVEPDKVYGQADFAERRFNQPFLGARSMRSPSGLGFDAAGNLWVVDAGNHRILRFPAAQLDADQPEADVVLGQPDFDTAQTNGGAGAVNAAGFNQPLAISFHPNGSLYAADFNNARLLVFQAPFRTGQAAESVLGQPDFVTRAVPPTITASSMRGPNSLYIDRSGNLFVAVGTENRVLVFHAVAQSGLGMVAASRVIGQPLLTSDQPNVGTFPSASASGLFSPSDVFGDSTGTIYVADGANHRLVAFSDGRAPATRVLGQADFARNGANRVGADSMGNVLGIAIDYSTDGFPLYVCDASNHRVLAWRSSLRFRNGSPADLVVGQPDFVTAIPNADTGRAQSPTRTSLSQPRGVAVDADGNLWVADAGNNRALRFPKPFEQSGRVSADTVLGQQGFFTSISATVNASSLRNPFGVAVGQSGEIYIADTNNNRVLEYPASPASGAAAVRVFGKTSFDSGTAPTQISALSLSNPTALVVDPFNFLVVADSSAHRVVVYPLSPDAPPSAITAGTVIGQDSFEAGGAGAGPTRLNSPQGVGVNPEGVIYVADSGNNRVLSFPSLFTLPSTGGAATQALGQPALNTNNPNFNTPDGLATNEGMFQPLGLFVDRRGGVWVGDAGNSRVTNFASPANGVSAATFVAGQNVSPGSLVSLFGPALSEDDAVATAVPLPTDLAGRVFEVNDEFRAGILFVSPGQANIQIPVDAPLGLQSLTVRRSDTDEVIAGGPILLGPTNPGLFTVSQDGRGQALALNQNGVLNSAANPAARGSVVQLFGTGPGPTNPVVPTGQAAPSGPLAQTLTQPARTQLECLSQGFVCVAFASRLGEVLFSGLAPGFVGLWQVNVKIPDDYPEALTGDAVPITLAINQRFSNTVTVAIR